jgi:uncharacterized protein HemY
MQQFGKLLIIGGIVLIIAGLVFLLAGNKLGFLGKLPGDIRIEKENIKIYIPITTMIILSVLATLVIHIIRKFF